MADVERTPLVWPAVRVRLRINDQKTNSSWKKTWGAYLLALEKEFKRMGVTRYIVTYNESHASRDPAVAVWFSRKKADNARWMDALGIDNPYPTLAEVDEAYRRLAPKYHPDRNPGIDPTKFTELTRARRAAMDFVRGQDQNQHELVIPCDTFREARHNLNAIVGTLRAIRTIERYGSSALYEQAFQAFTALPENVPVKEVAHG